MMRRLILASPFLSSLAGCSLVSCAAVLGIEERSVGSAEEQDASSSSTRDGGPTDAAPGKDARVAPPASDAGLGSCTTGSSGSFCDDFEGPLKSQWARTELAGGSIGAVNGFLTGRAGIIEVFLPGSPDSAACITRKIPAPAKTMKIAVDVRIGAAGSGSFDLFRIGEPGAPNVELEINEGSELLLDDETVDSTNKRTPIGLKLETGSWTRVELTLTVPPFGGMQASTVVNGIAGAAAISTSTALPLSGPSVFVSLGDCNSGTAVRWNVLYDDLSVLVAQ